MKVVDGRDISRRDMGHSFLRFLGFEDGPLEPDPLDAVDPRPGEKRRGDPIRNMLEKG
jgi:hypothetical protein